MKRFHIRPFNISHYLVALTILLSPLTSTYAACCTGHGGVASCNQSTGFKMCKDGTASPTCTCMKSKKAANASSNTSTKKSKNAANQSTSTQSQSKTTSTKTTKQSNSSSVKGCCSKHGGVAQCNTSTGYQMCKDGSQSPTCACH